MTAQAQSSHKVHRYHELGRLDIIMSRSIETLLHISMTLLMLSSAIELAFISSMVYWLTYETVSFDVAYQDSTVSMHGKPAKLLVNQGHTSNGAAGTAFILIGLGGILALSLRHRAAKRGATNSSPIIYIIWLVLTILSMLLTLAALIYTFLLTYQHAGQTIDVALAASLHNEPYPNFVAYPWYAWTPENWFTAMLELPLAHAGEYSDIRLHLAVMKGWRWNLIPMLVFGVAVTVFAFIDAMHHRRLAKDDRGSYELAEGKRLSA